MSNQTKKLNNSAGGTSIPDAFCPGGVLYPGPALTKIRREYPQFKWFYSNLSENMLSFGFDKKHKLKTSPHKERIVSLGAFNYQTGWHLGIEFKGKANITKKLWKCALLIVKEFNLWAKKNKGRKNNASRKSALKKHLRLKKARKA